MRRREFITFIGGSAAAWPLVARGQQPAMPLIGFLGPESADTFADRVFAFRQGLNKVGYAEGRNVAIEFRWAGGKYDQLPGLAVDLVRQPVAVIFTSGISAVRAAKAATSTVPIVFTLGVDPVKFGVVKSLNRPGANITGVSNLAAEVGPKRLELLHQVVPSAMLFAFLVNPANPNAESQSADLQAAARKLALQLYVLDAGSERDFDAVFAALVQRRVGGLVIGNDGLFLSHAEQLGALAARHAVPSIFQFRAFAAAGGLMSYGSSFTEPTRLAAAYVGRILKGDKPANLPVQQSTKLELILNLKTAKTLGMVVPQTLLVAADVVIE